MTVLRRLLTALSVAIGLWAAASVVGVLFDPLRIGFWVASLMWALLASLMIAPALVVMSDETIADAEADTTAGSPRRATSNTETTSSPPPVDEPPSFVDDARAAYPVERDLDPDSGSESEHPEVDKPLWEHAQTS